MKLLEQKKKFEPKKCEELNRNMGGTRVAEAWKTIKNIRKDVIEKVNIPLINILSTWTGHFKHLLRENRNEYKQFEIKLTNSPEIGKIESITLAEVILGVKQVKNGKSAGPGDIPIELIKYGPSICYGRYEIVYN